MADNQVILEFLADTAGLQAAAKQMLALGTISKEQFAAFNKANQESEQRIRSVTKAQSDLDKAVVQTTKDGKAMNDSFRQLTATIAGEVLKEAVAGIAEMGAEMHETTNKSVSLRTQLKAMKDEMATLDEGSERFQELAINAGKLTDEIGDINARIKFLASDTKWTDAFVATVNLATGSIAALQGGMALFGEESEDVQKALLKVNGAMALAQGTQQVFNALQKESAFMMGLAEAKTIAYGTALRVVDGISKTTGLSMAASWALATGGLTVLLGSVIALVSYLRDAEDATAAFADNKAQEQLASAKQQEELQASIYQRIKEQDAAFREDLDRQRKDYEIKGTDAQTAQFNMLTQIIEKYNSRLLSYAKGEQAIELTEQRETEINDIIRDATLARNAILKDADEKRAKDAQEAKELYGKKLGKQMKEEIAAMKLLDQMVFEMMGDERLREFAANMKESLDEPMITEQTVDENKANADQMAKDLAKAYEEGVEAAKKASEERAAFEQQVQQQILSFIEQTTQQVVSAMFQAESDKRQEVLDKTLSDIDRNKNLELSAKNLTEQQKAQIEEKYRKQEAEAKRKAWIADRDAKAEQALINGALALTMSLAQQGYPAGLITGLLALAQAGIQAGIIWSKPPPAFAKGTKGSQVTPPGFKLVGEEGPELIYDGGGKKVITATDTAKLLSMYNIPSMPVAPENIGGTNAIGMAMPAGMDYRDMVNAFSEAMNNNPSVKVQLDGSGFGIHLMQKGKSVHLLNNRYDA